MIKTYKSVDYIIHLNPNIGSYCAYVKLPEKYPNKEVLSESSEAFGIEFSTGYEKINVSCHGGLTFGKIVTEDSNQFPQGFIPGYWIGWDFAHAGDATSFSPGKKWTEEEVEKDCWNVIDQILITTSLG